MNDLLCRALFEEQTKALTSEYTTRLGWILHKREYPHLDVSFLGDDRKATRFFLLCDNWNETPPSIQLQSMEGVPLRSFDGYVKVGQQFNQSTHQITGLP